MDGIDNTAVAANYFWNLPSDDPLVSMPRLESFRLRYGSPVAPLCEQGHQGLAHDKEFALIYNRLRYLSPDHGRFVQRDPMGYADGMNLYQYVGSNPGNLLDPTALWILCRERGARADAEAENDDTVTALATKVRLNASEFKKWLKLKGATIKTVDGELTLPQLNADTKICPKERVTVPNTGYIDVGSYGRALFGWYVMGYKWGLSDRWGDEGLKVVYTGKWSTTKAKILAHLDSEDIYKFAFIGHGAVGCITKLRGRDSIIVPGKYTRFGIAEMHIIACESNAGASGWKKNVSALGTLRTVRGKLWLFNVVFVDERGQ